MLNLKRILSILGVAGLLLTSASFSAKAADGDLYDLNTKSVKYTRTEYLSNVSKYKDLVIITTMNQRAYGLEKDSKVFKIRTINDGIISKMDAGMDLKTAIANAYDGITEEGNASDYSQVSEDFDVATIE